LIQEWYANHMITAATATAITAAATVGTKPPLATVEAADRSLVSSPPAAFSTFLTVTTAMAIPAEITT
jgi:hypothetical protein